MLVTDSSGLALQHSISPLFVCSYRILKDVSTGCGSSDKGTREELREKARELLAFVALRFMRSNQPIILDTAMMDLVLADLLNFELSFNTYSLTVDCNEHVVG